MTLCYNKGLGPDLYRGSRAWVSLAVTLQRKIGDCLQSNRYPWPLLIVFNDLIIPVLDLL